MNYRYPLLMGIVLLAVIFPKTDLFSQCAYNCKINVTVKIPESGSYTLQPQDLMDVDPEGCVPFDRLLVTPADLTCASVGQTVNYEIRVEGTNFLLCTGSVLVEPAEQAVVYAKEAATVTLPPNDNQLTLTPELLIDSITGGNCSGSSALRIEPAFVDCSDIGRPVNYLLLWEGTNDIAAFGTITVTDPTAPQITVVDTFFIFLDEEASEVRVRPELAVLGLSDNCLSYGDLIIAPDFVDCTDANRDQPFVLFDQLTGDSLGSGVLAVRDTFSEVLTCMDTLTVSLPDNGFPIFLTPQSVIVDFADNCIDPSDMYVNPPILDCNYADQFTEYQLRIRGSNETLCTGIVNLLDNTIPEIVCVGDTTLALPPELDTVTLGIGDLVISIRDNCLSQSDLLLAGDLSFSCSAVGDSFDYIIYTPDSIPLCSGIVAVQDLRTDDIVCADSVVVYLPVDQGTVEPGVSSFIAGFNDLSCATQADLVLAPSVYSCGILDQEQGYTVQSLTRGDTVCAGTVIIKDTTATEIVCVDTLIIHQLEDGSTIPLTASDVLISLSDNCLTPTDAQLSVASIPCFIGSVQIDYQVTLPADSTQCTGVIEVVDTFAMNAICVDTLSRILPEDGTPLSIQPADVVDLFSDNCFDLSDLYVTPNTFDCMATGDTSIIYKVRVRTTNETVCSGIIEITDESEPIVICQDTVRVTLGADGTALAPGIMDIVLDFSDNCTHISQLALEAPDSLFCSDQSGPVSYNILLPDGTSACNGLILVGDDSAPVITCSEDVQELFLPQGEDTIALSVDMFMTSFGDNCATTSSLSVIPKSVDCAVTDDTLTYEIIWSFTGEVLCQGQFIVRDTFLPELVCRDTVIYNLPAFDSNSRLGIEEIILTNSNRCSSFSDYTIDLAEPSCDQVGLFLPYHLTYVETNDTLCIGMVQVIDDTPTTIICESQVDFIIPEGDIPPVIFPETVLAEFSDNCLRLNDLSLDPMTYSCESIGQPMDYTLKIRETDETLCTGVITFWERTAPIIDCKESVVIRLTNDGVAQPIVPGEVITSIKEDCTPIFDLTASISPSLVDCSQAGLMIPYTVTVSDASDNKGRCNGIITVLDDLAPTALCKDSVSVTVSKDGFEFPNPRILDNGSSDNCNSTSQLNFRMSPALFNCDDIGQTFPANLRVRDRAGNESTCTSVITVNGQDDSLKAEIIAPESIGCSGSALYTVNVENAGFFVRYNWSIVEGADQGWQILSSRSSRTVRVAIGEGTVKLRVVVENIGGCEAVDEIEDSCVEGVGGVIVTSTENDAQLDASSVSLFPNPVRDLLHLDLKGWSGKVRFSIYSIHGKLIKQISERHIDQHTQLNVSGMPAGKYILSCEPQGYRPFRTTFIVID